MWGYYNEQEGSPLRILFILMFVISLTSSWFYQGFIAASLQALAFVLLLFVLVHRAYIKPLRPADADRNELS